MLIECLTPLSLNCEYNNATSDAVRHILVIGIDERGKERGKELNVDGDAGCIVTMVLAVPQHLDKDFSFAPPKRSTNFLEHLLHSNGRFKSPLSPVSVTSGRCTLPSRVEVDVVLKEKCDKDQSHARCA